MADYFIYSEKEIEYLKSKDARLAVVIDKMGYIERKTDTDLFLSVIHHIIGQQISTKAQETIWQRMKTEFGIFNAHYVANASIEQLQSFGIIFKKPSIYKTLAERSKAVNLI